MRAVAEDDIEQNDRGLRIARLVCNPLVAKSMIDHGMRTAAGEHVVAEIDERVGAALPHVVERTRDADRRIRKDVRQTLGQQHGRLVAKRAAAKEAAHITLLARECRCFDRIRGEARDIGFTAYRKPRGRDSGILQSLDWRQSRRGN